MNRFAKWLGRINLVEAGLAGIYASMLPACYAGVKLVEGGANELVYMYALCSMFGFPTFVFISLHLIMKGADNEN